MNHRVGKVNQTTPLMKFYGKCFGCILLLPPVNLLRNAVLLSLNAYQSISKVNSKLQSGELRINLQWHKMERTELPISSRSPAFSLLPKCLYLVPLALIIFLFYICSFQEDQFGEKKKKKLGVFLGLWRELFTLQAVGIYSDQSLLEQTRAWWWQHRTGEGEVPKNWAHFSKRVHSWITHCQL